MIKKIFLTICLVCILVTFTAPIYAATLDGLADVPVVVTSEVEDELDNKNGGILNEIINQGNNFSGTDDKELGKKLANFVRNSIQPVVVAVGNLVFAAVTVILGAKYIWSSADGKAQVLESLPTFVIAVVFFYLGENLLNWVMPVGGEIIGAGSWEQLSNNIIWIINTVVHYAAFAGIIVLGLRYMFASAEGKSNLKTSSGALVIGMVFVFAASRVVDFIIKVADEII